MVPAGGGARSLPKVQNPKLRDLLKAEPRRGTTSPPLRSVGSAKAGDQARMDV